jgi:hypothetical protein
MTIWNVPSGGGADLAWTANARFWLKADVSSSPKSVGDDSGSDWSRDFFQKSFVVWEPVSWKRGGKQSWTMRFSLIDC